MISCKYLDEDKFYDYLIKRLTTRVGSEDDNRIGISTDILSSVSEFVHTEGNLNQIDFVSTLKKIKTLYSKCESFRSSLPKTNKLPYNLPDFTHDLFHGGRYGTLKVVMDTIVKHKMVGSKIYKHEDLKKAVKFSLASSLMDSNGTSYLPKFFKSVLKPCKLKMDQVFAVTTPKYKEKTNGEITNGTKALEFLNSWMYETNMFSDSLSGGAPLDPIGYGVGFLYCTMFGLVSYLDKTDLDQYMKAIEVALTEYLRWIIELMNDREPESKVSNPNDVDKYNESLLKYSASVGKLVNSLGSMKTGGSVSDLAKNLYMLTTKREHLAKASPTTKEYMKSGMKKHGANIDNIPTVGGIAWMWRNDGFDSDKKIKESFKQSINVIDKNFKAVVKEGDKSAKEKNELPKDDLEHKVDIDNLLSSISLILEIGAVRTKTYEPVIADPRSSVKSTDDLVSNVVKDIMNGSIMGEDRSFAIDYFYKGIHGNMDGYDTEYELLNEYLGK